MKTFILKNKEIKREWYLIDASNKALGRLTSDVALTLSGKKKTFYSLHQDLGDYVVLINIKKVKITGKKSINKDYYHYSGYPGGLKSVSFREQFSKNPQWVIRNAVKGMLPANRLRPNRLKRLKIFLDEKHPYKDKLKES